MIHIVIDNSSYPDAQVLGLYRSYKDAVAKYDELYDDSDPYGPGIEIVSWDIINNRQVGDEDGGTPVPASMRVA